MGSKVKVAVRVRPLNRRELDLGDKVVVDMMDGNSTVLYSPRDRKQFKNFAFDHCFWSIDSAKSKYADQEKVYECLGKDVLENAFEGYNACIFAYGQTGSGKTYTMMGGHEDKGVIPRLCDNLFAGISKNDNQDVNYRVEVSYIEIYNEKVRDLLCPRGGNTALRVREHKVLGPYVEGLTKLVVSSYEDIETIMMEGNKSRTVAATRMNTESSRSHAVFNIVLARTEYDPQTECIGEKVSKMSLVDLAGSERASKTGAEGDRLKEGSNINRSLTTLGQVISSLADQSSAKHHKKGTHFVPYRDSVLTWLLKDNLGGNSKTVMVATVSPSADNYEETLSTLRYADRAKRIVNHAVVNEDPNARIIRELREEVERLKQLLQLKIAGKLSPEEEGEFAIQEQLTESEKLIKECTMSWEQKEKQTEQILQERHKALEDMGISVQSSGIAVEKSKFYLVNLNADPSMNELLVYYLKDHTKVGRLNPNLPPPDIQLGGLGILPEHSTMEIEGNEVYLTPMPNARTFVNGKDVKERTLIKHGDRILWGNNHFFRINCPRLPGSEVQPEQPVDFLSAQQELMMNQIAHGPLHESFKALEEQYQADKEGALEKQRLMYEEKIEELRNQVQINRPSGMDRTWSMGSFSSGYGSRMSWFDDRDTSNQFDKQEHRPLVLKEAVLQANTLVREANQLSEEMGKDTEFAVTLQIPTSSLSFGRSRSGFSSEVAIVVKHKTKGTQIWSHEKLENKIFDMRELYNQCVEEGVSFSSKDEDSDLFFEVECHTLIGVTNVFLECLLHDVSHEYAAPIISQQGEVCGRLKVEVSRITDKDSDSESVESTESDGRVSPEDEEIEDVDDLEEFKLGHRMEVCVNVIEAFDLPPALCNYVFCQYQLWKDKDTVVVPPINASLSHPGPKTNTMIFENKQSFDIEITEEFLEYASEGSLAIEVWGNRSQGFDSNSKLNWNYNVETPQKGLHDRWQELVRKLDFWFEIHEINDMGVYGPVELNIREGKETGGIFQLRQGHSRRVVVKVNPIPKAGALPVVCNTITSVSIGSICVRNKHQQGLDSYQEKDLSLLREKWSNSLMKRREYLDQQIHSSIGNPDIEKSVVDKERESWLIDQWVCLTEERNAVLCPLPGSGIPGAPPLEENLQPGLEAHIPVIFLDLNDDFRNAGAEDVGPAGIDSTLSFENPDNMINLPIIKYDQKQVSATASWDSSSHDAIELTRVTGSNERVYLIVKVVVGLTSPVTMQLVLRKRICVRIYKKQSWKDSFLRRLTKDIRFSCGVVYELVSHIPRQPGEETEERASLAQMAAQAVGEEEEDETVLRRYSRGISNVESLLALDKLRQEVVVKEKLAAIGKPLRKFASTPNLAAATSDLSFGGGSPGRFDTSETRFLDFKSYGMNSERANRSFSGREETLIDLKSFVSPPSQSSTPTSSGVVLRNSGGRQQNPRPSSLIIDLETLSEDSKDTSPEVQIPDLFNFAGVKLEAPEVSKSPLPDDLRDRTASSDTIIFDDEGTMVYDDLPTPTPFQFMKGRSPEKSPVKTLDKTPEETTTEDKTPENDISVTTNSELLDIFSNEGKGADLANEISKNESQLLDLSLPVESGKEKGADSDAKANEISTKENPLLDLSLNVQESEKEKAADSDAKANEISINESPLLDLSLPVESKKDKEITKKDLTNDLISISNEIDQKSGKLTTATDPLSLGLDDLTTITTTTTTTSILPDIISASKSESEPKDFEKNLEEDKYLLSTSRDDLSSLGSREDLASSSDSLDWNESSLGNLKPGMAVWLSEGKTGVIRFTGATEFAPGMWVGVELDKAGGRNDGSVQGVRYFACKPRFGSFVRPDRVTPIEHSARERSTTRKITGSRDNTSKTSSNRALNKTESTSRTSLVKGTARRRTDSPGSGGRTESPSGSSRAAAGRGDNVTSSPVTRRDNAGANRKKDDWKRRSNILF